MIDYIIKGLLVAGLSTSLVLGYKYNSLRADYQEQSAALVTLTASNAILSSNNSVLQEAIRQQNEGIMTFRKTAEDMEKLFGTLNTSVKQGLDATNSKLDKAMKQPVPQTCEQTINYLLDAATKGEFK